MKRLIIALISGIIILSAQNSKAQLSVNINIGTQPAWGPSGYDHVDYYYLPDIETYYYVPKRQFIYLESGNWVYRSALPARYRTYNLYNGYKVVINSPRPYQYFNSHKVKYSKFKGYNGKQAVIKNNNSNSKGNPHSNGNKNHSQGKGKH
ncbi:hypothetical protein [Daejeonella sp. H1SJ63]|jgi:hypothetical protein|uniref:hypothetical protein n=1 Tax=Daejeonella sp. H1SJ63 TaxID=3034145 RepID=UPI0023ECD406|nr:hypothetical protein [Daejeonella sp. H1SJ63]